jgi:hypothetical protein
MPGQGFEWRSVNFRTVLQIANSGRERTRGIKRNRSVSATQLKDSCLSLTKSTYDAKKKTYPKLGDPEQRTQETKATSSRGPRTDRKYVYGGPRRAMTLEKH